ncbi:FAD/NAD(P)-binding protein [uncultured Flavobacterium sp.]|uniref:FAD/NAD(P)-binding protein n=1 Tax=uncultured Flavobacterium sp. TaxID=165435 RepID=UPI0025D65CFF|nr:FAD/NAD(P)-binding protein [uncultured Flavobacterium sp.]
MNKTKSRSIAILGTGPSGLFMFKSLLENDAKNLTITLFDKKEQLGAGMPYSREGANKEHITNVSANEIPALVTSVHDWIKTLPEEVLENYSINRNHFNEYKVLPRLLFGKYLESQFELLMMAASLVDIKVNIFTNTEIVDIIDYPKENTVKVIDNSGNEKQFDTVIICTGHSWPKKYEGKVPNYFDSPYPPSKLEIIANHPVAIKGSSLTAIDAIRTLARHNGSFFKDKNNKLQYTVSDSSPNFKIVMHSRSGLLPAVRFHLEDSHLANNSVLTEQEIENHKSKNEGFLSLDYIFEEDFKKLLAEKDPAMYARIKDFSLEDFTALMMEYRDNQDAFILFKKEYAEADRSIKREESIYWKELLAVLSFSMNYPAKYLSAEDMMRLQSSLMPLISIVIAFVPQASAIELIALHDAGILSIEAVGENSEIAINNKGGIVYKYTDESGTEQSVSYKTFVDCVGQPHLAYEDFPFKGLSDKESISPAELEFRSKEKGAEQLASGNKKVIKKKNGSFHLKVPGITINDAFQIVNVSGEPNQRIYMMAVPYIGGYNPDYSGLDFCEEASGRIAKAIHSQQI